MPTPYLLLSLSLALQVPPAVQVRPGAPSAADTPVERDTLSPGASRLVDSVSEARLTQRVRDLVALGSRGGGTASGAEAVLWRVAAFEAIGIRVTTEDDPETAVHQQDAWELALVGSEGSPDFSTAHPWGFSPAAEGSAPLSLEWRAGTIFLGAKLPRRRTASPGPLACLIDGQTSHDGRFAVVRPHPDQLDTARPVFGINRFDGAQLREWLTAGRELELKFRLTASRGRAAPQTVVGILPGDQPASSGHLLFCAHGDSDSGGPGANDNGSGESIVFEIATVWAEAIARGALPPPPVEVRFAIWGKEIHSSRAYLKRARERGEPPLAVVNFDQSGYGTGSNRLYLEPDDLEFNRPLLHSFATVLRTKDPRLPSEWATIRSLGGTDSYVFSRNTHKQPGIPAITVYTSAWDKPATHRRTPNSPGASWADLDSIPVDYDNQYHSSGDLPENTTDLEPFNMAWCTRAGLLGGLRYLKALK